MNRQQLATKLAMDALGLPVQMGAFDDRLVLQKAIYLAQASGLKLGYYFQWYLRGPYCSDLASDGFAIAAETAEQEVDQSSSWKLDDCSRQRLQAVRPLVGGGSGTELARWLELLASVHFLVDRKQAQRSSRRIAERLNRLGKSFSENEVERAVQELSKHGLVKGVRQSRN
ncbi:MAG: hypothetical protein R6X20_09055 [Phycisphaerae bacterium]